MINSASQDKSWIPISAILSGWLWPRSFITATSGSPSIEQEWYAFLPLFIQFANSPGQGLIFICMYSTKHSKTLILVGASRHEWNTNKLQYFDQHTRNPDKQSKSSLIFSPPAVCFSVTCLSISKPQQTSNQAAKRQICGWSGTQGAVKHAKWVPFSKQHFLSWRCGFFIHFTPSIFLLKLH